MKSRFINQRRILNVGWSSLIVITWLGSSHAHAQTRCETPVMNTKLVPADGSSSDNFGESVALDGNVALIGAKLDDLSIFDEGSAYVFRFDGRTWQFEQKLTASDGYWDEYFGAEVAVREDMAAVGAWGQDGVGSDSGAVYVFQYDGAMWSETQKLISDDLTTNDLFGYSLALSDEYLIVGAAYAHNEANDRTGAVYVFERDGESWGQVQKITGSQGDAIDYFGASVSIFGDTLAVGAVYDEDVGVNEGSAYVFRRLGTVWVEEARLLNSAQQNDEDRFGTAVALSAEWLLVGEQGVNTDKVLAWHFNGSAWSLGDVVYPGDFGGNEQFGQSLALEENTAVIGSAMEDANGTDAGAFYVFELDGTNWSQTQKVLATDGSNGDEFGYAIAMSGGNALIGARSDNDAATDAGSAYVFAGLYFADCNGNGVSDEMDIDDGTSEDTNENCVPDECEPIPCLADVNGDRVVDPLDVGFVQARFGCQYPGDGELCLISDVNTDGVVDPLDAGYVLARFGDCV